MQLVMGSDDFGYSVGFNMGLKKVIENEGPVTYVALMSDTPGAVDAMEFMRQYPWISVSWHMHFRGKPQLPPEKVPSLVDKNGRFRFVDVWNPDTFNPEARKKRFEGVKYEEILEELRAQLLLFEKHMGRVPDCGGGHAGDPVGDATLAVCEEFGIPTDYETRGGKERPARWAHVKMQHVHQPGQENYLVRTNEDSYIRNCTYDPIGYLLRDEQNLLSMECPQITWHCGWYDDYMFQDATYFYCGDRKFFEPSPLMDTHAMLSPEVRQWIKDNKIELISMADAIYGTKHYQNHLRSVDSDLWIGNILKK